MLALGMQEGRALRLLLISCSKWIVDTFLRVYTFCIHLHGESIWAEALQIHSSRQQQGSHQWSDQTGRESHLRAGAVCISIKSSGRILQAWASLAAVPGASVCCRAITRLAVSQGSADPDVRMAVHAADDRISGLAKQVPMRHDGPAHVSGDKQTHWH